MTKTKSQVLAEEYLHLGGRRRSKFDDNIATVRAWEDYPPEAERFWRERIALLNEEERREVEFYLPDINTP